MSQVEVDHWLNKAEMVKNEGDGRGSLKKRAVTILTANQRENRESELEHIARTLSPDNVAKNMLTAEGRSNLAKRRNQLNRELDQLSPPNDLSGDVKDALYKREKELAEDIKTDMVPQEVMWRNPVGAVDQNLRWHNRTKFLVQTWKNIKRLLNPDDRSQDLANVEQLRPSLRQSTTAASYMMDAQLPGHFAMSSKAKDNWPQNMPPYGTVNSPLKQAEKNEEKDSRVKDLEATIRRLEQELSAKTQRREALKRHRQIKMAEAREKKRLKRLAEKEMRHGGGSSSTDLGGSENGPAVQTKGTE